MSDGEGGSGVPNHGRLLVLLVVFTFWGLITHGTHAGSGDEPHYLVIAHSVAFDGDLDVANDYRDASLIGGGTLQPDLHARRRGEALRPVHDIGMPVVFAPFVRVAYTAAEWAAGALPPSLMAAGRLNASLLLRHQISLAMALLCGLLARELYDLLRERFNAIPHHALLASFLFAVTPPALAHGFLFFTEIPSALIMLVVFRRVVRDRLPGAATIAGLGMLTGFLLLVHVRNVGLAAGLVAVLLWRALGTRDLRPALLFVAGVMALVLVRVAVTRHLWGGFVATPLVGFRPEHVGTLAGTAFEVFVRLTGLLFDREYGLLAYAPLYLLAAPGLLLLVREQPGVAAAALLAACAYLTPVLLPVANPYGWMGGWSPAARFLVPVVPLLWLGVYAYIATAAGWGRVMAWTLIALQIGLNAYLWQFPKALWNEGDGVAAFGWAAWLPTWTAADAWQAFAGLAAACALLTFVCTRRSALSAAGGPPL